MASGRPSPPPPPSSSPRFSFIAGTRPAPPPEQICTESSEIRVRFRPLYSSPRANSHPRGGGERLLTWFGRRNRRRAEIADGQREEERDRPRAQFDVVVGGMNPYILYLPALCTRAVDSSVANRSLTSGPAVGLVRRSHQMSTVRERVYLRYGAKRKAEVAHCGARSDSDVAI